MCKRVAQFGSLAGLIEALHWSGNVREQHDFRPLDSIVPLNQAGILHCENDELVFDQVRWGWCPRWTKVDWLQVNARADKICHSSYWRPIWQHRALCPINGWFEWRDDGIEGRRLYFLRRRDGRTCLVAAAGQFPHIGREAHDDDGFVLVVAEQRGSLLDPRALKPVILEPQLALEWLNGETSSERAQEIIQQFAEADDAFEWILLEQEPDALAG